MVNFRNYSTCELKGLARVNLITGKNGSGKTNLIDGVYYICFGRSYFSSNDRKILNWDESFFRLEGLLKTEEKSYSVVAKVIPSKLKEILINDKKLAKISELIGRFPIIAIAPKEIYTLLLTSEARRKLIDQVIAQSDQSYLQNLLNYNAYLARRNASLKMARHISEVDKQLMEVLNVQLDELGHAIHQKRKSVINQIQETFQRIYGLISLDRESCYFRYKSQLDDYRLKDLLENNLEKDLGLQRTTVGIHKDDLKFFINDEVLNAYGSQGQLKSFIISLKLALFNYLTSHVDIPKPILLLDDIFDKFDEDRTQALMSYILGEELGQVFITDASDNRMKNILESFDEQIMHIRVDKGELSYE